MVRAVGLDVEVVARQAGILDVVAGQVDDLERLREDRRRGHVLSLPVGNVDGQFVVGGVGDGDGELLGVCALPRVGLVEVVEVGRPESTADVRLFGRAATSADTASTLTARSADLDLLGAHAILTALHQGFGVSFAVRLSRVTDRGFAFAVPAVGFLRGAVFLVEADALVGADTFLPVAGTAEHGARLTFLADDAFPAVAVLVRGTSAGTPAGRIRLVGGGIVFVVRIVVRIGGPCIFGIGTVADTFAVGGPRLSSGTLLELVVLFTARIVRTADGQKRDSEPERGED